MADFLDFSDIVAEVELAIKDYKSAKNDLVKAMVNMVYFEMLSSDVLYPLFWLVDFDDSLASVAPSTLTDITVDNPAIFTTDAVHGLKVGDLVTIHNVAGMTEVNDLIFYVDTVPSTTTFRTGLNTSTYTAYTSGGTAHHRGKTLATSGKDVQKLLWVSWHNEDIMTPITPKEIEESTEYHYIDSTMRPERFYHGKSFTTAGVEANQIFWHPGADAAYGLRYWFEARPSLLSADAHVPLMPPQFHYGIVAGAITRLAEQKVQVENQVIWPGIYGAITEAMKTFNRKYWKDQEDMGNKPPYLL